MPEMITPYMEETCMNFAAAHLSERLGATHEARREWMRQWLATPRTLSEGAEMIYWLNSLPDAPLEKLTVLTTPLPDSVQGDGSQAQDAFGGTVTFAPQKYPPHPTQTVPRVPLGAQVQPPVSNSRGRQVRKSDYLAVGLYEIPNPANPIQMGQVFIVRWNKDRTAKYAMTVRPNEVEIKDRIWYDRSKPSGGMFALKPEMRMSESRALVLSDMLGLCIRCCAEPLMSPKCIGQI